MYLFIYFGLMGHVKSYKVIRVKSKWSNESMVSIFGEFIPICDSSLTQVQVTWLESKLKSVLVKYSAFYQYFVFIADPCCIYFFQSYFRLQHTSKQNALCITRVYSFTV